MPAINAIRGPTDNVMVIGYYLRFNHLRSRGSFVPQEASDPFASGIERHFICCKTYSHEPRGFTTKSGAIEHAHALRFIQGAHEGIARKSSLAYVHQHEHARLGHDRAKPRNTGEPGHDPCPA